jgi:predicted aspartyl protease
LRRGVGIASQQSLSRYRDEARKALAEIYGRNGIARKALEYDRSADHSYYSEAAKRPEMSVARRGYARVQVTRDPEGRIMLPVAVGGKESRFVVDTGTALSWLRKSEASVSVAPFWRELSTIFRRKPSAISAVGLHWVSERISPGR